MELTYITGWAIDVAASAQEGCLIKPRELLGQGSWCAPDKIDVIVGRVFWIKN